MQKNVDQTQQNRRAAAKPKEFKGNFKGQTRTYLLLYMVGDLESLIQRQLMLLLLGRWDIQGKWKVLVLDNHMHLL